MKKRKVYKIISNLPETIDRLNDILDDQQITMIDFMDGDQVLHINVTDEGMYTMLDIHGMEIDTVDKTHIERNEIKK